MIFVPNRAQAQHFFIQRDGFVEVIMFALMIKADLEREGQVVQEDVTTSMSIMARRRGFTIKLYAFVKIINVAALCKP
jgi:hypothetical protein